MSNQKPKIGREEVKLHIAHSDLEISNYKAGVLVAIRGYYMDTKGDPGQNDVGIYDDVLIWYGQDRFEAILANTDPSKLGWNPGVGKPYAMLVPGVHFFIRGAHKGKTPALRQAHQEAAESFKIPNSGHFKVYRARSEDQLLQHAAPVESGYFAINIHAGGESDDRTSSWGCITAKPSDFFPFMKQLWEDTRKAGQDVIPLLLVDNTNEKNRPQKDEKDPPVKPVQEPTETPLKASTPSPTPVNPGAPTLSNAPADKPKGGTFA